ncbi:MAG: tetratricopeptide repeat protein [Hyphomicrobiales bacterium]|nr:tetratricopeptide repeat protein [Hyphomicrobiales bacterium]
MEGSVLVRIAKKFDLTLFAYLTRFSITLSVGLMFGAYSYAQTVETKTSGYVGSKICAECHQETYQAWDKSHHSWALRMPDSQNVLGDFNDAIFSHKGVKSRFFTDNGRYFVETPGGDGKTSNFEVKYAIGVEPLQQYILELEKGRLQVFDIAWDTQNKRWFPVFPDQDNKPGNGLHWTGPYKNWQAQCAECHQTRFVKGYNPSSKSYASSWQELNVACGACHGPAEAHVEWARNPENFSAARYPGVDAKGMSVTFAQDRPATEINACARCHSRREPLGANSPAPGSKFADNYNLALLRPGLYHADGQINDEVYVYGSFLQSRMHARGVRCSNCHEPHSAVLKAEGNAICTQCHSPAGNTKFPTLKLKDYDAPEHHHHSQSSEGARCENCHMPSKTYMIVDPRRDHSFRVPRPDLSVKLNTPNACSNCHDDKPAKWAAKHVEQWYPEGRSTKPHFAELFTKARRQSLNEDSRNALVELALDQDKPSIVRATSLNFLGQGIKPEELAKAIPLLKADEAHIRAEAVQLFRGAPDQHRYKQLVPMLKDPTRSVRISAARELLNISADSFKRADRKLFSSAVKEYQNSLLAKADFPQVQMALGGLAMLGRNFKAAEAAFREAITMDPQLDQAWLMITRIQLAQSRLPAARKTLLEAIEKRPQSAQFHRMLGAVSLQLRQPIAAVKSLERATVLLPNDIALMVELGNAQFQAQTYAAAINTLSEVLRFDPDNANALYLSAHAYLSMGKLIKAKEYTLLLRSKHPNFQIDKRLTPFLSLPMPKQ